MSQGPICPLMQRRLQRKHLRRQRLQLLLETHVATIPERGAGKVDNEFPSIEPSVQLVLPGQLISPDPLLGALDGQNVLHDETTRWPVAQGEHAYATLRRANDGVGSASGNEIQCRRGRGQHPTQRNCVGAVPPLEYHGTKPIYPDLTVEARGEVVCWPFKVGA